jgi:hypothetical protein
MLARANMNRICAPSEPRNTCDTNLSANLKYYYSFFSRIVYCTPNVFNLIFRVFQRSAKIGGTLWRSWLGHCARSWKVAGSIPHGVTGIFH